MSTVYGNGILLSAKVKQKINRQLNFIQANQYVGFLSLGLLFLGPIDDNDESRTVLKINGIGYGKFCLYELDHHCTRFTYPANCNICLWLFA